MSGFSQMCVWVRGLVGLGQAGENVSVNDFFALERTRHRADQRIVSRECGQVLHESVSAQK